MRHEELLIDGSFWGGSCDQSISKSVARDPYTGRTVGTYAEASRTEANAAAEAAFRAFHTYRSTSNSMRAKLLLAIADEIHRRSEDLADTLRLEVGKPISLARGEVARMELTFRIAASEAIKSFDEPLDVSMDPRSAGCVVSARRFPIGPILAITPYNWPFNLAAHKIAPALAAGCTIVVKGAPQASLSSLMLGRLLHEAGVPPGVVNFIQCDTPVARELTNRSEFAMISFTGSPDVGWEIKRTADPRKRVTLELGGNAFVIITSSADLERAVRETAESAFSYAGQICISAQHVLVDRNICDRAKDRLAEATHNVKVGDPADPQTLCGPLISKETADRIESLIAEAISMGAEPLVRGQREGNLLSPTLLANVPVNCRLASEEAFGPVLTVEEYTDLPEAISRINSGRYGIHAALYSTSRDEIDRTFEDLQVGGIVANGPPSLRFDSMPYGGVKYSGFGREGVRYAIEEMTEWKALIVRE